MRLKGFVVAPGLLNVNLSDQDPLKIANLSYD